MPTYRHPYNRQQRPDELTRPPLPAWLQKGRSHYSYSINALRSYTYWTTMYWATPPWMSREQVAQMKDICESCPPGYHIDHVVPLKGATVCGLNVPWNLNYLPCKENLSKGNTHWPDMPMQPVDMFDPHKHQPFELQLQEAG